jgi:hypothetical protein
VRADKNVPCVWILKYIALGSPDSIFFQFPLKIVWTFGQVLNETDWMTCYYVIQIVWTSGQALNKTDWMTCYYVIQIVWASGQVLNKYWTTRTINNQHNAQICTTALFYMLAPTCFGSSLPSSGSFWISLSYVKIQIDMVVYLKYATHKNQCLNHLVWNKNNLNEVITRHSI